MSISFFRSRQFPRLCSALVVPWIFLYLYFAILPSYQSGLYRLSETQIETSHVDIPGYAFEPIHGQGNWRVNLALFSLVTSRCLVVPMIILSTLALFLTSDKVSWQEKLGWSTLWITVLMTLWLTAPAANAFASWLIE